MSDHDKYRLRYRLAFGALVSFAKEIFQAFQIFNLPILKTGGWVRLGVNTSVRDTHRIRKTTPIATNSNPTSNPMTRTPN